MVNLKSIRRKHYGSVHIDRNSFARFAYVSLGSASLIVPPVLCDSFKILIVHNREFGLVYLYDFHQATTIVLVFVRTSLAGTRFPAIIISSSITDRSEKADYRLHQVRPDSLRLPVRRGLSLCLSPCRSRSLPCLTACRARLSDYRCAVCVRSSNL